MKRNILFLVIFIVIFAVINIFSYPKQAIISATSPIIKFVSGKTSSVKQFFLDLKAIKNLSGENRSLREKVNSLESELANLKEAKTENETLRKELSFTKERKLNIISAQVISRTSIPFLQTLVIDKGKKDGITEGQVVISQGHLIAQVKKVNEDSSEINLVTSSHTLVPVKLQENQEEGLLKSDLSGLYIDNIPVDKNISVGQSVLTSNLNPKIPEGILVGKVEKTKIYKSQIFQNILVKSDIDFSKIKFVFVVKND